LCGAWVSGVGLSLFFEGRELFLPKCLGITIFIRIFGETNTEIMKQEQKLFNLIENLDEDNMSETSFSFHDISDHINGSKFRCYHSDGYSFEILREFSADEGEAGLLDTDEEGYWYNYYDLSEDTTGYKELPIKNAIKMVMDEGVFV